MGDLFTNYKFELMFTNEHNVSYAAIIEHIHMLRLVYTADKRIFNSKCLLQSFKAKKKTI